MHIPRKRFGQHFLQDEHVIHQIIGAIAPTNSDHLVEIGPGQGALTFPLLNKISALDVIELDRDLIPALKKHSELTIHQADALRFDFASLVKDEKQIRIFGNLPYNISTPLIFHLLDYANIISDMIFMLQKEVVDRMTAKTGDDAYGRLSIMVQYHYEAIKLFDVAPQSFNPPPKVWSSIVKLIPYKNLPIKAKDYSVFESVVKQAFNQRRKTLRNALKNIVSDEIWEKSSLDSKKRPEELRLKEFVELSDLL